ncbi:MAG: NAD(P)-dependent oxidoreductase [Gemmatimonadaceae bacterium]
MRALVTGATGLVGSYIAARLSEDGWAVRALVRDAAPAMWLTRDVAAELHVGDVTDRGCVAQAARGCDTIFHAAAHVTAHGGWESFRTVNIGGTRHVVDAAADTGARLVHISSVAVYGPATRYRDDGRATDEDTPLDALPSGAHYARSKRESEALVLEAHTAGRVWAVALRPDVVYGRRDRQLVPRVTRALRFGVAPVLGRGEAPLPVVHAANVADAAVRAATQEHAGGRAYNVANDFDLSFRELITLAAEGLERTVRVVSIPVGIGRALVTSLAAIASVVRRRPPLTTASSAADFITRGNPFTSERARRELGWSPRVTPAVGVPDAFRWQVTRRP